MATDTLTADKTYFAEMVALPNAGHKLILAAKTLREKYQTLTDSEKTNLVDWVKLISNLNTFITGEDQTYFIQVAVVKKGLRRANVEHLAKYSSEEVGNVEAPDERDDEYVFNIWKSEFQYIKTFLNQFDIAYRIV